MSWAIAGGKERLCTCASMGRDGAACSCDRQGRGHETAAARQLLVQGCLLTCRQRGCELISLEIPYMTACEMEMIADPERVPGSGLSSPLQVPGTD